MLLNFAFKRYILMLGVCLLLLGVTVSLISHARAQTGLTFNQITHLETDYFFPPGNTCSTGTPRFSIGLSDGKNLFVYIGPPSGSGNPTGCPDNTWVNTGNLACDTCVIDTDQEDGNFTNTFGNAKTEFGGKAVDFITFVVDNEGFHNTVFADNTRINDVLYTYDQPPGCNYTLLGDSVYDTSFGHPPPSIQLTDTGPNSFSKISFLTGPCAAAPSQAGPPPPPPCPVNIGIGPVQAQATGGQASGQANSTANQTNSSQSSQQSIVDVSTLLKHAGQGGNGNVSNTVGVTNQNASNNNNTNKATSDSKSSVTGGNASAQTGPITIHC